MNTSFENAQEDDTGHTARSVSAVSSFPSWESSFWDGQEASGSWVDEVQRLICSIGLAQRTSCSSDFGLELDRSAESRFLYTSLRWSSHVHTGEDLHHMKVVQQQHVHMEYHKFATDGTSRTWFQYPQCLFAQMTRSQTPPCLLGVLDNIVN